MTITTIDGYEAATQRAQALMGATKDSPEEAELIAITDAIAQWDETHDDATAWKD